MIFMVPQTQFHEEELGFIGFDPKYLALNVESLAFALPATVPSTAIR